MLAVAIVGKFVGTYVAARVGGIRQPEAVALGWLMNTRGLTELIVLNIGLSLGVISPLLFTMLVIMALVTTFMTSPLLEWSYSKDRMRQDLVEVPGAAVADVRESPLYRVLVPVANPDTQQELVQLATTIAGTNLQSAIVNPLNLVLLEEDYAFESTPAQADRLIAKQQAQLQHLIESLEPSQVRQVIHPIVRISNDVARETVQIAEREQADLILMGWHRPAFSDNRLGGRVGQILTGAKTDVAVFIDKHPLRLNQLLVPYRAGIHNDLGLELALRILVNHPESHLTVLRVNLPGQPPDELSYEFRGVLHQLHQSVRDRIMLSVIESSEPLLAVITASETVDLTIAGASREWGIERQTLGKYTDDLAVKCHSSLLITRRYSEVTSHLAAVLTATSPQVSNDVPKSNQPGSNQSGAIS